MLPKKLKALAAELSEHEDELRADLQQYYGIDLDRAEAGEHAALHVAALTVQLPQNARVRVAADKDNMWTLPEVVGVTLLNAFNHFMWAMGDPKKRGAEPQLLGPQWMRDAGRRSLPARVLPVGELIEELSKPRR